MWSNFPEIAQLAKRYDLNALIETNSGMAGERLGSGTGASLEFQEFRPYQYGDDLRHLDWGAYARADALMIRLHRNEIRPQIEILIDGHIGMQTDRGQKAQAALKLTGLLDQLCEQGSIHSQVRILQQQKPATKEDLMRAKPEQLQSTQTMQEVFSENRMELKSCTIRILLSDFLTPLNPEALVRSLSRDANGFWLIQVLTQWEQSPSQLGGRRLVDQATQTHLDLKVEGERVTRYRQRLQKLQQDLAEKARQYQGQFLTLIADKPLAEHCRETLTPAGFLLPR